MMDVVGKLESELKQLYDNARLQTVPSQDIWRKVDACSALSADLLRLMKVSLIEEGEAFDPELEKSTLRMLLDSDAGSTYGSTASRVSVRSHCSNHPSESPRVSAERPDTAAQLAAKRAEIELEAVIEAQRQQLKRLESQRDKKYTVLTTHPWPLCL